MSVQVSTARTAAVWVLRVALGAYFVYSGLSLFGDGFVGKFDRIGFGQGLRYVTGVLEVAGGLGLLVPLLGGLAALGLAAVMTGAVITELIILGDPEAAVLPALLLALSVATALLCWDDVRVPGRRGQRLGK
ncbi:DoxX family protein [Saccharothrix syringae]|uniref:DoxX family membrane protein n=1 Tax=Saccharothrix syringae TaxID=103733 RepID=A0A5Q0GUF6_SACSY|nr:DoxX family protein [Saccharothrix syringae]QFZ17002.1 DoxX family membrane protein [Saccharothrix syringae]